MAIPIVHTFYSGKLYLYDLTTQHISTVDWPLIP